MNFEWAARRGGTACWICAASSDGMVNWEKGILNGLRGEAGLIAGFAQLHLMGW